MAQVTQRLMTQILAGPEQAPLAPEDGVEAARHDWWTRILLALTDDAGLHAAWARAIEPGDDEWDSAGRLPWVRAQIDEVDKSIDRALEGGRSDRAAKMLDALARAGIGWGGDPLDTYVASSGTDEDSLAAFAMVAAAGESSVLRRAVGRTDVFDEVIAFLRGASIAGASELWDQFLIWHSRLADATDESGESRAELDELEGIGACLDPALFARGLIAGDYEMAWASRSELVADFLQSWGATDWLEVAALLEHAGSTALEACSVMAVNAARGIGLETPDEEEAKLLIELLEADTGAEADNAEQWEPMASDLGFQFQIAVGATVDAADDKGGGSFGGLLAQIAAHERLVHHGIHSPGVPGLPLSATSTRYVDLDAATLAIRELGASVNANPDRDGEVIRAVRTLCDAATWCRRKPESFREIAVEACGELSGTGSTAIELARAQIAAELEDVDVSHKNADASSKTARALASSSALATGEKVQGDVVGTLGMMADGESIAALDAARRLGLAGDERATRQLATLWTDGPVRRASFFRSVLLESLAS